MTWSTWYLIIFLSAIISFKRGSRNKVFFITNYKFLNIVRTSDLTSSHIWNNTPDHGLEYGPQHYYDARRQKLNPSAREDRQANTQSARAFTTADITLICNVCWFACSLEKWRAHWSVRRVRTAFHANISRFAVHVHSRWQRAAYALASIVWRVWPGKSMETYNEELIKWRKIFSTTELSFRYWHLHQKIPFQLPLSLWPIHVALPSFKQGCLSITFWMLAIFVPIWSI